MHALLVLLPLAFASTAAESCPTCNPDRLMDEAERTLGAALTWHLPDGAPPRDLVAHQIFGALERAEQGELEGARPLALQAATTCLVSGERGCGEPLALLAEIDTAGGPERYDEALAWLALVPYEDLGARTCLGAVVLRYRLAERRSPRSAEPSWADRCGAQGGLEEPGYRAAKAALLKGDLDDAERRIARVRAFGSAYGVRAQYLFAVARTARGDLAGAAAAFAAIAALPPARHRSEAEEDARVLALLQLARVAREEGRLGDALAAYRSVPSLSPARADALVEGAIVAAHEGDLGAARNYLEALPRYRPGAARNVEVARLLASLAAVEGDELAAASTFAALTREGELLRGRHFGPDAPPLRVQLASDPSLGGILDENDARRLLAIEGELVAMAPLVDAGREDAARVRRALLDRGVVGPERRALDMIEEAHHLLRRAEGLLSQRERDGLVVAGPEGAALRTFGRAVALRRAIDDAKRRVGALHAEATARALRALDEVERDLDRAHAHLAALDDEAEGILDDGFNRLARRADDVVHRLEMSEDVGRTEILWQRKRRATLEVQRVHTEYSESRATLRSDSGAGSE